MNSTKIFKEITPLTQHDCFTIFSRVKQQFDFPFHQHDEYELNLILNANGAKRIVGDHIEVVNDLELVLVGPNLPHAWFTHECSSNDIHEITIQWHKDLLDERLLKRNQLSFIRKMFELSSQGITFSKETKKNIKERIIALSKQNGFGSVIELMLILHDLSISRGIVTLSDPGFSSNFISTNHSRRLEKAFEYINNNYDKPISLQAVSKLVNMTEVSFSRFIKKRTGITFIDSLNSIRLGHASRMLIETTHSIAEISYNCGFNNISNFNRIFKKKKGYTPSDFRLNFSGNRIFI